MSPSAVSHKSQPYTPRVSGVSPKKKKPRLSADARLECYQEMHKWVYEDNKRTQSPEHELRKKYPKLGKNYFYDLLKNFTSRGTIFHQKPSGRPPAYGEEYDNLIRKCVDEQRAKQNCASALFIRNIMIRKGWKKVPTERWIRARKKALGFIKVPIKLKPGLNDQLFEDRLAFAEAYLKIAKNKKIVVVSFDETNFHEANEVAKGQCYEVLKEEAESVPNHVRFARLAKETTTQEKKVMYGAGFCPYGGVFFEHFDHSDCLNRKGLPAKGVNQDFFLQKKVFKRLREAALKVIPSGKKPFLMLDKAPGHRAKDVTKHLDQVWGKGMWALQAGKMPDSNDGDVGMFPFMKRTIAKAGGASSEEQIHAQVKKAWRKVTPDVCKAVRKRVMRNMAKVVELKGGNWYDESRT